MRTFPASATLRVSTERTNNRTKLDVDAFELVLHAHISATLPDKVAIPGSRDGDARAEGTVEVG